MSFLFSQPAPGILPANSVDFSEVETIGASTLLGNKLGVESTIQELSVSDVSTLLNLGSLQPLDSDLTAIAGLSPANDDLIQRKAGVWTNRTPAQFKTDLSLTKSDVGLSNVANVDQTNASNISSGTLSISYGGTGQTTANAALNALLPIQGSSVNKFLKTDGSNTSWADAGVSTAGALEHQVLVYDGAAVTWAYAGLGDGSFGTGNIILGANKPTSLSGTKNILISSTALNYLTTETNNIIFTNTWVPSSSAGSSNVVIGIDSTANYSGDNVIIGANTNTNGLGSVAIGRSATVWGRGIAIGRSATANGFNGGDIAIGPYANATGSYGSIAIGDTATSSGNYSTVLGHTATASSFTDVVAIGNAANAGANNQIAIGSGARTGAGVSNLIIGYQSGRQTAGLTGANNTVVGSGSFNSASLTTAANNTIVGQAAAVSLTTHSNNTAIGFEAANNLTATNFVAIGYQALKLTSPAANRGDGTVSIGYSSGIGDNGQYSVHIGYNAGKGSGSSGGNSVYIGGNAGESGTSSFNTAVGYICGQNAKGILNAFYGYESGRSDGGSPQYNSAFGAYSLDKVTTSGEYNSAIGYQSGYSITSGARNVTLGAYAGYRSTTQSNELFIDNRDRTTYAAQQTDSLIYGTFNATAGSQTLFVNAKQTVRRTTSATNTVTPVLQLDSESSGTPANGIGVSLEMAAETSVGNTEIGVVLEAVTTDVTSTSEDFDLVVKNMAAGATAAETLRVASTGTVTVANGDMILNTAGNGLKIKTGADATAGLATISNGNSSVTVNTNKCSATSIILVTNQTSTAYVAVTTKTSGSFKIEHANPVGADQECAWFIINPA